MTNVVSLVHCLSYLEIFSYCVFDYLFAHLLPSLWESGDMSVTRPLIISSVFCADFLCLLLLLSIPRQTLILTNILFSAKIPTFLFVSSSYLLAEALYTFLCFKHILNGYFRTLVRSWKHLVHIKAASY